VPALAHERIRPNSVYLGDSTRDSDALFDLSGKTAIVTGERAAPSKIRADPKLPPFAGISLIQQQALARSVNCTS
jgi:hypothetical protein